MELVLTIGNFHLKGALFEDGEIIAPFLLPLDFEQLKNLLSEKGVSRAFLSVVNLQKKGEATRLFEALSIPFSLFDPGQVKITLDVDEPDVVPADRIANVYGALHHFPQNDCIVVDLGAAVTFDVIGSRGVYLGGAIYPGPHIGAEALASYSSALTKVKAQIPEVTIGRTTEAEIQSGLYWGLLGAVERITSELRLTLDSQSDLKIIATGGLIHHFAEGDFTQNLSELVDLIDPALTLLGLYEIMKEQKET